jgi:hypothetical protein
MMRTLFVMGGLAAMALAGAAQAQPQPDAPTVASPPDDGPRPLASHDRPVPAAAADGLIYEWGPPTPVVEAAPAPATSYPPCTKGRTDSCTNPDPSRELPYYPPEKG